MNDPVPSKRRKSNIEFKKYLFDISNQFTLDEFKRYTNFTETMARTLQEKFNSTERLDYFVKAHFKKTLPDEKMWKKGGFQSLKLTDDFFQSDTAARIFRNIFGIKKCSVNLVDVVGLSETPDKNESDEVQVLDSSSDESVIDKIDLTKDDISPTVNHMTAPILKLKYPRKRSKFRTVPSGIATYAATNKFVDQIRNSNSPEEEVLIVSESENIQVEPPNQTLPKEPKIIVLSDVTLVKGANIQEQITPQPDPIRSPLASHNIAINERLSRLEKRFVKPLRRIGPKSVMEQQNRPHEMSTITQWLASEEKSSHQEAEQRKEIAGPSEPKSRMNQQENAVINPHMKSTNELFQESMLTDPSRNPVVNQQESSKFVQQNVKLKRKIGPKSVVSPSKISRLLSPEELLEQLMSPNKSIGSPINEQEAQQKELSRETLQDVGLQKTKNKIGPLSGMKAAAKLEVNPPKSTQELLEDLVFTAPAVPFTVLHVDPSLIINQLGPSKAPQENVEHKLKGRPKSRASPLQSTFVDPPSLPPEVLLLETNQPPTEQTEIPIDTPQYMRLSKPKIGPKSRMNRSTNLTTALPFESHQEVTQNDDVVDLNSIADVQETSQHSSKILPTTSMILQDDEPHTSSSRIKPNVRVSASGNTITTIPCRACLARTPLNRQLDEGGEPVEREIDILQGENKELPMKTVDEVPKIIADDSPMDTSESTELIRNFEKAFQDQWEHIIELFKKYTEEAEPTALSLKSFWYDFVKYEYENDSSAAETQLNNSNEHANSGPNMDNESQTVLHRDQVVEQSQIFKSQVLLHPDQLEGEQHEFLNVPIKVEKVCDQSNLSNSSDVMIIEVPPDEPIEILMDNTQDLVENLELNRDDSDDQLIRPLSIPQSSIGDFAKASTSKGFLTTLPKIQAKKRLYPPLDIVVEAANKIPLTILPDHDFSQQPPSPPSNENYEIEECTMTDSQFQRYELLNNENTLFLSSQLEYYAFKAGNPINKSTSVQKENAQPMAQKRLPIDQLNYQPHKRQRCTENIIRELNWKIMNLRTIIFKPLSNKNFHLELQLRNNFDTFYVQDLPSIKRMLRLSDNEWKSVATVLTALNGFRYDFNIRRLASQNLDLMSRLMGCFVRSIPLCVRSNIQFKDFMGHCLEVNEQKPLVYKCTDSAIDPIILQKMRELKRNLDKKNE